MQRYFVDFEIQPHETFTVTGQNFQHLVRVMRAKVNDCAEFVSSDHLVYVGRIQALTTHEAVLLAENRLEAQVELPLEVTIACGLPKGDKAEFIVQKGTELGARHFTFLPTQFSVAKWPANKVDRKLDRLQKIAHAAAEQSHRTFIPTVSYANSLKTLIKQPMQFKIVAYEESAKQGEHTKLHQEIMKMQTANSVLALFGPEGGLAGQEVQTLEEAGFVSVGLGPRILRAETAPLYLLSAISVFKEMR
ncbi:16S rRNA (uracil(1498)-N(3))-methyltransferase [Pediococcus siamensis]|uniref:16S rRNA (uracil(1498)-N(3))-methyltransferase n=1 Tax=Pediococcus siamensis TaxID=381829 RepID=UPI0039A16827